MKFGIPPSPPDSKKSPLLRAFLRSIQALESVRWRRCNFAAVLSKPPLEQGRLSDRFVLLNYHRRMATKAVPMQASLIHTDLIFIDSGSIAPIFADQVKSVNEAHELFAGRHGLMPHLPPIYFRP